LRYRCRLATSRPFELTGWLLLTLPCTPLRAAEDNSALSLIEHGTLAMRDNPDQSRQDAERAFDKVRQHPDADLEIRARLLNSPVPPIAAPC
jgi:hypothetical protein